MKNTLKTESNNKTTNDGGIVYILTNEAMPGYVKIGKTTTSVEQRTLELSRSSAVPIPFECYYAARVADVGKVEQAFHIAFGDHRINPKREFFSIAPEKVVEILRLLQIEEVTPSRNAGVESKEDAAALEKAREKRPPFNFKMVDIPAGAELRFTRDSNISCRVAPDQKHVEFRSEVIALSEAARRALNVDWPAQGPLYWTYEDEILDERRMCLEGHDHDSE